MHANQYLGSATFPAGVILVQSKGGKVSTFGNAISSFDIAGGSDGGRVTIQAGGSGSPAGDILFDSASIQVQGDGGSGAQGGTIAARSFQGDLSGTGGELIATGTTPGTITLEACLGATYSGTSTPAFVLGPNNNVCVGSPTFPSPANTLLPAGTCATDCQPCKGKITINKTCVNQDTNPPTQFGFTDTNLDPLSFNLGCAGSKEFPGLDAGNYTVTETLPLPAPWSFSPPITCQVDKPAVGGQSSFTFGPANNVTIGLAACEEVECTFTNTNTGIGICPKFPTLAADKIFTIDPNDAHQIQNIVDDPANVDKVILIMPHLGKKTENIVISKRIKLYGCSITLTAADSALPVVDITSGANGGFTKDVHATGSTVAGYEVSASNHQIRERAFLQQCDRLPDHGELNLVNGALGTINNGIGVKIDGNSNTLDTNNGVENTLGDGVVITAAPATQ